MNDLKVKAIYILKHITYYFKLSSIKYQYSINLLDTIQDGLKLMLPRLNTFLFRLLPNDKKGQTGYLMHRFRRYDVPILTFNIL